MELESNCPESHLYDGEGKEMMDGLGAAYKNYYMNAALRYMIQRVYNCVTQVYNRQGTRQVSNIQSSSDWRQNRAFSASRTSHIKPTNQTIHQSIKQQSIKTKRKP
jgi:hypothetical protein